MLITAAAFAIALGILVLIHEAGHFLAARKLNVGVEKFSLGFGPKIVSKKIKDTEYLISAIPLGGYVKLLGEDPSEECNDLEHAFSAQPLWKRFSIVFAGPFCNLVLPVIIFTITFMIGVATYGTKVGEVIEDSAAMAGGMKNGDKILAIDSKDISRWEELKKIVSASPNRKLSFRIKREDEDSPVILYITPKSEKYTDMFGEEHEEGRIGIIPGDETVIEKYNPFVAIFKGVDRTWYMTKIIFLSILKLIQGKISPDTIGGPILIAQMAGQQAKMGIMPYLYFIAMLSINLGILNLLPIPVLDGGHIFFFAIEAIMRRPIPEKKREFAQQVGLFMLVSLMLFAFYNDIMRNLDFIMKFLKK